MVNKEEFCLTPFQGKGRKSRPPTREDRALEAVSSQLEWKVIKKNTEELDFKIRSYRAEKKHVVYFPRKTRSPFYKISLLHEFIHALHCETLHPSFTANRYKGFLPSGYHYEIQNYFNVGGDWFVAGHVVRLCEEQALLQMQHDYELIRGRFKESLPDAWHLTAGLISAQAVKWLDCQPLPGKKVAGITEILLAQSPERPTLEKLHILLKGMLDVFRKFTVELVDENGCKFWRYKHLVPCRGFTGSYRL